MSAAARVAPRAPPCLTTGARVALVAPAGPLRDDGELARACDNARALGWQPVVGASALARRGYLAGADDARLADVNATLRDATVDGIWCLRGGYGSMRILERIDYDALRRRPKAVIGYSDVTALHLAIAARAGVVSFHGPTARGALSAFSRDSLARAVVRGADSCGPAPDATTLVPGRARGTLVGGNLALVAALVGTPFAPRLDGAILVLEDVNEPVYRIDRMLMQLRLSGLPRGLRGLVFGAFTERGDERDAGDRSLDDVLCEAAAEVDGPCLAGVPVGHIDDQWTLPLGAAAELDAECGRLTVEPAAAA
jgi:muramoyltetrapeptide carboxypeptidase